VVVAIRLAHTRERRWLDAALAAETEGDGISVDELAALRDPARRRAAVHAMHARAGRRAADLLRRLQREQINLAMVASRVASPDDPALLAQREHCRSLRDALGAIPGATSAAAGRASPGGG
jgi:hypothetical protein